MECNKLNHINLKKKIEKKFKRKRLNNEFKEKINKPYSFISNKFNLKLKKKKQTNKQTRLHFFFFLKLRVFLNK